MELFYLLYYYWLLTRFYKKGGEFHINDMGYSLRYKNKGVSFVYYKEMLSYKIMVYRMKKAFEEMRFIDSNHTENKEE